MTKILVDREEIEAVRNTLKNGGGAVSVLRWAESILAQPAEAEGVEVVAWRYTSSQAFGRRDRRWHYQETFPEAGARQVQEIGQLDALVRESDHLAALSAVTAERDSLLHSQQVLMQSRNAHRDERDRLRAELQALRELVGQCVEYLNPGRKNSIASGSILHRALTSAVEGK